MTRFEEFAAAYPKEVKNRYQAETAYCRLLLEDSHLTEADLIIAAENYAEAVSILGTEERYIKQPQNFLKDQFWVAYLEDQYQKPQAKPKNRFSGFQQRDYDFTELEKQLMQNQGERRADG